MAALTPALPAGAAAPPALDELEKLVARREALLSGWPSGEIDESDDETAELASQARELAAVISARDAQLLALLGQSRRRCAAALRRLPAGFAAYGRRAR
ncbi:MAG: hypothetical protein KC503_42825 [Myxococcales bacterium]|nr:hypothetical protein [Myxococcales bacterium]